MSSYIIVLLIILGGGAVLYFGRMLMTRRRSAVGTRLGRYGVESDAPVSQIIAPTGSGAQAEVRERVNRFVLNSRFGDRISKKLREADLKVTPGEYVLVSFGGWIVLCMIGLLIRGILGLII